MIAEQGIESYGIYWTVVEILAAETDHKLPLKPYTFTAIAVDCKVGIDRARDSIDAMINQYELFISDGEKFWSDSLLRRMKLREIHTEKRRAAGRKGGMKTASLKQCSSGAQAAASNAKASKVKESKVKESKVSNDPSNNKILTNITNPADAVSIRKGMVYFRCSDNQYQMASEWYRKKGLNPKLIPIVAEQIDNWLQSDTPNAKKARKNETHYRRLYSAGFLDEAQRLFKIQQGGASRTRFEAAMNEIDSAFGTPNVIDAEVA